MAEAIIRVNGRPVINTFKALKKEVKKLERELLGATIGSEEFIKKAQEVKQARAAFEKVKNEINAVRFATQNAGNFITRFVKSGMGTLSGFTMDHLVGAIRGGANKAVDELLKLADAMADVRKTTGMTQIEVKQLWDDFDQINTRTDKMDLLKISAVGGRLGITDPKEIADFTQEIDKAYVALGDNFSGGLEVVAEKLGKVKNLFSETKEMSYAEAVNRIGSALNDLAADGTSSEENISDFALRVGQLPSALKPGTAQVLGLGAAFEESGIDAKIASSGFTNFILTAGRNIDKFAYSMNIGVEEAQKLLETHPEEFFLRFAQGMKGIDPVETTKIFESLKLNTNEVVKAVGAASDNTDLFNHSMKNAAVSMAEMSSLQDEFNIKNETAGAIWDKIRYTFIDLFTSGQVFGLFEGFTQGVGKLLGVTQDADDTTKNFKDRIFFLADMVKTATVGLIAYIATSRLYILITTKSTRATIGEYMAKKWSVFWTKAQRAALILASLAQALYARNLKKATKAMKLFNATTGRNPLGLLLGLLASVISYFVYFRNEVGETTKALSKQEAATKGVTDAQTAMTEAGEKSAHKMKNAIEPLIRIIESENATLDMRKRAYEDLIAIAPEFENSVDNEYRAIKDLGEIYRTLAAQIVEVAKAKGLQNVIEKKAEELAKAKAEAYQAQKDKDREDEKYSENREYNKRRDEEHQVGIDAANTFGDKNDRMGATLFRDLGKKEDSTVKAKALADANQRVLEKQEELNAATGYRNQQMDELLAKMKALETAGKKETQEYKKLQEQLYQYTGIAEKPTNHNKNPNNNGNPKTPTNRPSLAKIDTGIKEALATQKKWGKEVLSSERENWDLRHKITKENLQTEIDLINEQTKRKLENLESEKTQILSEQQEIINKIKTLEVEREKPQTSLEDKAEIDKSIAAYESPLQRMDKNIQIYADRRVLIEDKAQIEIKTVREKYIFQSIEDEKNAFEKKQEREKVQRELEIEQMHVSEEKKKELRKQFEKEQLTEQTEYLDTLKDQLSTLLNDGDFEGLNLKDIILTDEGKEALIQNLEELGLSMDQIELILARIKNGGGEDEFSGTGILSGADVLGMSPEQWETLFDNIDTWQGKVEMAIAVTKAMQQVWATFYELQSQREQERLSAFEANAERKKEALQKQLDNGYITQSEYDNKVKKLEEEVEKRRALAAYKQAKYEKQQAIISAIISTAQGVAASLSTGGVVGIALAAIVGALGAAQIAMIASQPLPPKQGYAQGGHTTGLGYTDESGEEVAGVVHKDEYVVPKWLKQDPVVANVIDWLEAKRTGNDTPFARGGNVSAADDTIIDYQEDDMEQNQYNQLLYGMMLRLNQNLEKWEKNGISAYVVADEHNGEQMRDGIRKYERLKNKNKR